MGLFRMGDFEAMRPGYALLAALGVLAITASAGADEPRKVTEPTVLHEPAEITQVVDAFDDDDPFDLHLSLGYQQTWTSAKIRRESFANQPGLSSGDFTADNMNVAN